MSTSLPSPSLFEKSGGKVHPLQMMRFEADDSHELFSGTQGTNSHRGVFLFQVGASHGSAASLKGAGWAVFCCSCSRGLG